MHEHDSRALDVDDGAKILSCYMRAYNKHKIICPALDRALEEDDEAHPRPDPNSGTQYALKEWGRKRLRDVRDIEVRRQYSWRGARG